MDAGERGAGDISAAAGTRVLPAAPRLRPRRHGDAPPLLQPGGGVYRPQEPQVRDAASVGNLCVREDRDRGTEPLLFFLDITFKRLFVCFFIHYMNSFDPETVRMTLLRFSCE